MGKIEKLKELNNIINDALINLETYIFVKNIKINEDRIMKNYQSKVVKSK